MFLCTSLWRLELPEGLSALNPVYGVAMLTGSVLLALVHVKVRAHGCRVAVCAKPCSRASSSRVARESGSLCQLLLSQGG